jgi:hypothetical protein
MGATMIHFKMWLTDDDSKETYYNVEYACENDSVYELGETMAHALEMAGDGEGLDLWLFTPVLLSSVHGFNEIGGKLQLIAKACENSPDDAVSTFVVDDRELSDDEMCNQFIKQQCLMREDVTMAEALRGMMEATTGAMEDCRDEAIVGRVELAMSNAQAALDAYARLGGAK